MNLPFTPIESPLAITLDIETSDTAVTSRILTIGAEAANLLTGERLGTFYVRIELDQPDRTDSPSTMKFWSDQQLKSPNGYKEAWSELLERVPLREALSQFNRWVAALKALPEANGKGISVMGNGCEFDNAIVIHAMEQVGLKPKWRFRDNDSVRTVVRMGRLLAGVDPKYQLNPSAATHHALEDAVHEMDYVLSVFHTLLVKLYPDAINANAYTVFVGGTEANALPLTLDKAMDVKQDYLDDGYDDVAIAILPYGKQAE